MARLSRVGYELVAAFLLASAAPAAEPAALPRSQLLVGSADLSREMIAGIDRLAERNLASSIATRVAYWRRDYTSAEAYVRSVKPNRDRLSAMIGVVDSRVPPRGFERVTTKASPEVLAETDSYQVFAVRWPVFDGVHGEGVLLQPKGASRAQIIVLPDADETPAHVITSNADHHFAHRLAALGCQVLVMTLIDRGDEGSGNGRLGRFTNQTHREWVNRPAFQLGRHIIGYEVQKVLAAVDVFQREAGAATLPIGVTGQGEGGLIALHAAALDQRIQAAHVSGYFESRQQVWREPLYRNVFGLLREFGDAEIASLIAPRTLVVSPGPAFGVAEPPAARKGRPASAAPGSLQTPDPTSARAEMTRAQDLCGPTLGAGLTYSSSDVEALARFIGRVLGPMPDHNPPAPPALIRREAEGGERQLRLVRELERHTQILLRQAEETRNAAFWRKLTPRDAAQWAAATQASRARFRNEIIGPAPEADRPPNPRTRRFEETAAWTGYEVVIDLNADVFAWGYLLLPKDLKPGERRPVVVCQHGLEGLPADTINRDSGSRAFATYQAFAARLAERGFVVFAPHNPYRGGDAFRMLQRKLNPVGRTLYGVMLAQHERILDFLAAQPFVDERRIGFYGLSYGGKTALRLPALLDRYAVSICSGDFNEWIQKTASVDLPYSYLFAAEHEMFEFNLGATFGHAEMAALIAPRPFMVERGHQDGVGTDEWVSYEYAKVRRLYAQLKIPERTTIEYFNGPHMIHGVGTFEFLHRHLAWPAR